MFAPAGSVATAAARSVKLGLTDSIFSQKYCWHSFGERQQFAKRKPGLLSEFYRQTDRELIIVFPGAAVRLDFIVTGLRERDRELFIVGIAFAAGPFPGGDFEFSIRRSPFIDELISRSEALPGRFAIGLLNQQKPINPA